MVHSTLDPATNLPVTHERPGLAMFLQRMSALYEIVIFTAAVEEYASGIIDSLDPQGLILHRLYRRHTRAIGSHFVKDLSVSCESLSTSQGSLRKMHVNVSKLLRSRRIRARRPGPRPAALDMPVCAVIRKIQIITSE